MTEGDSTGTIGGDLPPRLFMFAAAGVCLGLSDVWRFPQLMMQHDSLWFPVLYLAALFGLGVPLLTAELVLARLGYARPAENFGFATSGPGASRLWQYAGVLVIITVFLVLCYAVVVAGWTMAYAARSAAGSLEEISVGGARLMFHTLVSDPERLLGWHTLFVLAIGVIAGRGVRSGTGAYAKRLVIAAYVVAGGLALATLSAFGPWPVPRAGVLPGNLSVALVADAVTQAFFTLGVCMGAMLMLGTCLQPGTRMFRLVLSVVVLDVLFVMLACAVTVPLLAGQETVQPGISFAIETVPRALSGLPLGRVYLFAFFVLLFLLVATTAIVLMEFLVSWIMEKTGRPRASAVTMTAMAAWIGGLLALSSFGGLSFEFDFVGEQRNYGLFDVMDILSSQILLPVVGLLMTVFVGWNIDRDRFADVLGRNRVVPVIHGLERYLVPAAMVAIFIVLVFHRVVPRV